MKLSPVSLCCFSIKGITCTKSWSRSLRDGDHANREAHILVGIAKTRTWNTGNTGLLKERESVHSGAQLAPIVDCGDIVDENALEHMFLFNDAL